MIDWKTLKKDKWIVAVSGGADSFALLSMCIQHGLDVICAHVNYHKRDSADRDMQGVQSFCQQHHVMCCVYEVSQQDYQTKQNFQALAREIRYRFFRDLLVQYQAAGVLVAHHQDDLIETYRMQQLRNSVPTYYGISADVEIYGMRVKRILLQYTKQQLIDYCEQEGIVYYDDESNFTDDYTRNKIRHSYVEKLSEKEKEALCLEIIEKNNALSLQREAILRIVETWGEQVEVRAFQAVPASLQVSVLREWIVRQTTLNEVHFKNMATLARMLCEKNNNFKHNINETYFLCVEYGRFMIDENIAKDFSYVFDQVAFVATPYFTTAPNGEVIQGVTLHQDDFPITIRNAQHGDKIKLRMGTKKVARMFIDNKISHKERKVWPVIVNCKGNVIFVHKIGCDIEHYSNKSTLFVLK